MPASSARWAITFTRCSTRPRNVTTTYEGAAGSTPEMLTVEVFLTEISTFDSAGLETLALLNSVDIDSYEANKFVSIISEEGQEVVIEEADFTEFYSPFGIRGLASYEYKQPFFGHDFHLDSKTELLMRRSKTVMPPDLGVKLISNATNTTPITITTALDHGFSDGDHVTISDVEGNTAANGQFFIADSAGNSFTLISSAGNGAYVSGGEVIDLEYRVCIVTVKNHFTTPETVKCIPFAVLQEEEAIYLDPPCHRGLDHWETTLYRGANDYPSVCLDSDPSGANPDCSIS